MDKKEKSRALLKVIVIILAVFAVYKIISLLVLSHITDSFIKLFISELMILACGLAAAKLTGKLNVLKWTSEGLGRGIVVGIALFVQPAISLVIWLMALSAGATEITVGAFNIILFLLSMLLVGLAEELLFRGVLLNGFLDYYGEGSVSAIRKAIVFSSLIFGFMHIFNILIGVNAMGACIQAINAVVTGTILGTVYVRSGKNLWPGVILHAILDLTSFLVSGALMGVTTTQSISMYSPASLIPTVIMLFVALFILRKKKLQLVVTAEDEKAEA